MSTIHNTFQQDIQGPSFNYEANTIENHHLNLQSIKASDINNKDTSFPDFYSNLSDEAKEEFESLWNLVQSIKANDNAHTNKSGSKTLITTGPLNLNSVFKENQNFNLANFLNEQNISLEDSFLNDAKLNGAELNGAKLDDAELNDAELNFAELNDAKLNRAELNRAELNFAELNDAELNDAKLNDAKLNGAKLNGAKLNGAKLDSAELNGTVLDSANFSNKTKMNESTLLNNLRIKDGINVISEDDKEKLIKDQNEIKDFFVSLGAEEENISFAA